MLLKPKKNEKTFLAHMDHGTQTSINKEYLDPTGTTPGPTSTPSDEVKENDKKPAEKPTSPPPQKKPQTMRSETKTPLSASTKGVGDDSMATVLTD